MFVRLTLAEDCQCEAGFWLIFPLCRQPRGSGDTSRTSFLSRRAGNWPTNLYRESTTNRGTLWMGGRKNLKHKTLKKKTKKKTATINPPIKMNKEHQRFSRALSTHVYPPGGPGRESYKHPRNLRKMEGSLCCTISLWCQTVVMAVLKSVRDARRNTLNPDISGMISDERLPSEKWKTTLQRVWPQSDIVWRYDPSFFVGYLPWPRRKCWTSADLMNGVKEAENGRCWPPHSGFKMKNCDLWPTFLFGLERDWRQRVKETSCPQIQFGPASVIQIEITSTHHGSTMSPIHTETPDLLKKRLRAVLGWSGVFPLLEFIQSLIKIQFNGNRSVPASLLLTCSQRQYLSRCMSLCLDAFERTWCWNIFPLQSH